MSGSELLSKQRRYNIGEYKNLNRLTANTVTLDYLKFGMDTSNVIITYPDDLINDGYNLVLPNRSGVSGEFLGIDDNNKLKWGNPNVINNVQFKYGYGLNSSLLSAPYTRSSLITPDNYEITIKPTSTTSKLWIQFRVAYQASFSADTAITFELWKRIGNNPSSDTMIQSEADLGPINATGTNKSQYVTSSIIESGTTEEITIYLGFKFNNLTLAVGDILPAGINVGILGDDNGYKNSLMVTDFEGSGAYSTLLSKSHDNESIYYNLGTLFLGSSYDSLNTNNISSLSLKTEEGISAPLFIGHLQGNVTGNYVITDNITCLNLTSNVINTNILNGNIITTDELYSNIFTTNTLTLNIIISNTIITYDISINNSLKTKDLDVFGNLHVHGTQTIVNSEVLNVADNIIIVNADGNIEKQAGIQANIDGNLYDLFFDICLNGWSIYNKNLHLNKLLGNNISLTENITAQWFNGNINSNFVNVSGNININDNYILDVSAIKFSDGTFFNNNILNENIESINSNISTLQREMNAVEGNITLLQGNVSTLQTEMDAVEGNITLLQGNVSTLQTEMGAVEGNITLLQGNVSSLLSNINQPVKTTSNVTFNSLTISNEVIINGNLTVRGNTTIVDSIEYIINDPLITLNSNGLNGNIGIQGNTNNGNTIQFVFDQTTEYWHTGGKAIKANIIGDISGRNAILTENVIASTFLGNILGSYARLDNLRMFGDIELNNNYILDVSAIRFKNGIYINGNNIPYIHSHLDYIYANLTLIGNSLSSGDNSISNLQSNVAILQGNIISLQNQIEESYTSNSNVIFNDISANGNLNVGGTANLNKVVINESIDYFSDHINLDGNFTFDPYPWRQIGGNINIQGNNLNVYKYLNVSNDALFKKDLTVNGNIVANKFIGELSGNSLTSNKWSESKLLNVNGNISGNVLINANETMSLSLELEKIINPGIYGNNNSFPIITLDNYGRITDISLVTLSLTGGSSTNTDIGDILNVQYISTDILATSGYIRTNKIVGGSIEIDSNDLSIQGILTATHINADSITISTGSITVNKIISSNAIFTNDITVTGNLSVLGTQTILNTSIVEIDDNIIIVNADGELLKDAGLSANIGGNLYNFVFDICSNSWTTQNNNLSTNKLTANIIELRDNITAPLFKGNLLGVYATLRDNVTAPLFIGNLSGTRANLNNLNMFGNINLNNNYWINDVSGIKFTDGTTLTSNIANIDLIISSGSLDNLTDTNISTPITNGSSLIYNTSNGKWENTVVLDLNTDNLVDLTDTNISSVANNEILKYNSSNSKWENSNLNINEIFDVNITSLQNGEVLKYNSTSSKWENQDNTDTLNELTDVTLTGSSNNQVLKYNGSIWVNNFVNLTELADTNIPSLNNGDILRYNSTSQKWETNTFNIDDLDNVNIISVANNEVLKYNSITSKWENSNNIDTLDELGDVTLTSVTSNDLLRYDGANFVNTKIAFDNDFTNVNFTSLTNGDLIKYNGSNFINFAPTYLDGVNVSDNFLIKVVGGVTTQTSFKETSVLNTSTSLKTYISSGVLSVPAGSIETEIFDTTKQRMHLTTSGIAYANGITITSDGRVGIGVVNPTGNLEVYGTSQLRGQTTIDNVIFDERTDSVITGITYNIHSNVDNRKNLLLGYQETSGTKKYWKTISNYAREQIDLVTYNETYGIPYSATLIRLKNTGTASTDVINYVAQGSHNFYEDDNEKNGVINTAIINLKDYDIDNTVYSSIRTTNGGDLQFFTNSGSLTEKMKINSAGDVDFSDTISHKGVILSEITSGTPNIDQIYKVNFSVVFNSTSTWFDVISGNVIPGGTYIIQMYCNDRTGGGEPWHYEYYYSGIMSYAEGSINDSNSGEIIYLHSYGHARNGPITQPIQLRTKSTGNHPAALQIRATNETSSTTWNATFRFRRMI